MAEITDVVVVEWAKERMRTMADSITRLKYLAEAFAADYAAAGIDAKLAGNNSDDVVVDGAAENGRNPINRASIVNERAAVDAVAAALAANVGATGLTVFQIVNALQINGSPR